jgi:hypothetical protein
MAEITLGLRSVVASPLAYEWRRISETEIALLLLAVSAGYYLSYAQFGVDITDEGELLNGALSALSGQWPIADFVSSYPPGMYWGLAIFFKVLGTSVFAERIYLVVVLLLSGQLLYYVARQVLSPWIAVIPTFAYVLAPGPWYKVFFLFALLLPVAALVRWHRCRTRRTAFIAGICTGIAVVIRWEAAVIALMLAIGIVLLRTAVSFWWRTTYRDAATLIFCWTVGALLPVGTLVFAYAAAGKLRATAAVVEGYPAVYARAYSLFPDGGSWLGFNTHLTFTIAIVSCVFLLANGIWRLWKWPDESSEIRILLVAAAVGGMSYQCGFWWAERILQCYALVYVVWTVLAMNVARSLPAQARTATFAPIILLVLVAYRFALKDGFYSGSIAALTEPTVSLGDVPRLGGVRIFQPRAADMAAMIFLARAAGRPVIPFVNAETAAFITGMRNTTRYQALGLARMNKFEQQKVIDQITAMHPTIILERTSWEKDTPGTELIIEYARAHYRVAYAGDVYDLLMERE